MTHDSHPKCQALCPACEIGPFTRNHYFNGKLMLERDFTDEQRYQIDKLRHHHQRLHGWGVVCGLKVKQHENPACRDRYICIEPGTAIDCCGHEIMLLEEECVDITQLPSIKKLIDKKDNQPHALQICLRYRECPTEEIPVLFDECGCNDARCAPNRILESYDVDVMVDPPKSGLPFHTPHLGWHCTIGVAHASRVALDSANHRMYVITADDAKTVFQIDTDNNTVIGAHALPEKGLELAVSKDGTHVYVVTGGSGGSAADRQLVVLDTANNMGNLPISTSSITGSTNNDLFVSVAPAPNSLIALLGTSGEVLIWPTTLDTASLAPSPTTITLGQNLQGLVIGSKANEAYTADSANSAIQVLDIAGTKLGRTIQFPGTPFSSPSNLALVTSAASDMLAVVNQTNKQLYLVGLNPDTLVGSVPLTNKPIDLAVSPDGKWAYVLEEDTGSNFFVQTVNLNNIQLNLPPVVGTPFPVGAASQQIRISDSGDHLYIPFTDDLTKEGAGGVAILHVSEQACEEILWRHLDGCPHCDTPNCVVLGTIESYHVGDKIENQTDPPSQPGGGSTFINNRQGRHLLPSTQVLKELIECLQQQGPGGTGTPGPPGPPGAPGKDGQQGPAGPGLEQGLVGIEALSWTHGLITPLKPSDFLVNPHNSDVHGIVIGFTDVVQVSTLDDHIFQVLVITPDNAKLGTVCRCAVRGKVVPVDLALVNNKIAVNAQGRIDSATFVNNSAVNARGVAFLFRAGTQITKEILNGDVTELWVILRGDFVLDKNGNAIDAEFVRAKLPTGNRFGKQLGIQGGLFESWFKVTPLDQ